MPRPLIFILAPYVLMCYTILSTKYSLLPLLLRNGLGISIIISKVMESNLNTSLHQRPHS